MNTVSLYCRLIIMSVTPFSNIPQECRNTAASLNRDYFWGVKNEAGQVFYEGQNDCLSVAKVPGIGVMKKPITDPWNSICLHGATEVCWIPVNQDGNVFQLSRQKTGSSHLTLMRKQSFMSNGSTYTAYVIGCRFDEEVKEMQLHICPPVSWRLPDGRLMKFEGGLSKITAIGDKNDFERFVEAHV